MKERRHPAYDGCSTFRVTLKNIYPKTPGAELNMDLVKGKSWANPYPGIKKTQ
jgi:hypothetical protein